MRSFVFPHKHLYPLCVWYLHVIKAAAHRSLFPLADYRNLFLRFPFCLPLHLAPRALRLNVLDVRAVRRHVRHSACMPALLL